MTTDKLATVAAFIVAMTLILSNCGTPQRLCLSWGSWGTNVHGSAQDCMEHPK